MFAYNERFGASGGVLVYPRSSPDQRPFPSAPFVGKTHRCGLVYLDLFSGQGLDVATSLESLRGVLEGG